MATVAAATVTTKISKAYLKRIDDACTELRYKRELLDAAVMAYNEKAKAAWAEIEQALEEYNEEIEDAEQLRGEIASDMAAFFDEKSEKWKTSPRGEAYERWMEQWQDAFEQVTLQEPDELDVIGDIEDFAEKLGTELPFQVEE